MAFNLRRGPNESDNDDDLYTSFLSDNFPSQSNTNVTNLDTAGNIRNGKSRGYSIKNRLQNVKLRSQPGRPASGIRGFEMTNARKQENLEPSEFSPLLESKTGEDLFMNTYTSQHQNSRHRNEVKRLKKHLKVHTQSSGVIVNKSPIQRSSCCMWCTGCCCFQCVRVKQIGIVETFGQFQYLLPPGLAIFCWPATRIVSRLSLRLQQLDITCETKTKDNVYIHVEVSVLYKVIEERAYDAYYSLTNPHRQIQAYVYNIIRSTIPTIDLDDVFVSKTRISDDIHRELNSTLNEFGYRIIHSLVTRLSPNSRVKASMNEMKHAKYMKEAMSHQASAVCVEKIKLAEAHTETLYLNGVGTANERKAICEGMKSTLADNKSPMHTTSKDIMDLLIFSQYYNIISNIGGESIMLAHDPGQMKECKNQLNSYFKKEQIERIPGFEDFPI